MKIGQGEVSRAGAVKLLGRRRVRGRISPGSVLLSGYTVPLSSPRLEDTRRRKDKS